MRVRSGTEVGDGNSSLHQLLRLANLLCRHLRSFQYLRGVIRCIHSSQRYAIRGFGSFFNILNNRQKRERVAPLVRISILRRKRRLNPKLHRQARRDRSGFHWLHRKVGLKNKLHRKRIHRERLRKRRSNAKAHQRSRSWRRYTDGSTKRFYRDQLGEGASNASKS